MRAVRYSDFADTLRPIEKHRAFAFIRFSCVEQGSEFDSHMGCGEFWNKPRLRGDLEVAAYLDRLRVDCPPSFRGQWLYLRRNAGPGRVPGLSHRQDLSTGRTANQ